MMKRNQRPAIPLKEVAVIRRSDEMKETIRQERTPKERWKTSSFPDRATQVVIMTVKVTTKGTSLEPFPDSDRSACGWDGVFFLITVVTFLIVDKIR